MMPLGEVANFVRGITFKPDDVVSVGSSGVVGCMRTKNVQEALDLDDVWGVPEALVRRPDQFLRKGDVLVSSANSWNLIGKCCPVPELPWPSTFGGFVSVLRADEKQLDSRYLYRWFSARRTQATVRSFGQQTTNISNLNVDRCRELRIPLPPLAEQRRIADIIDRADAMRAKRRQAIAKAELLPQSAFASMFGEHAQVLSNWPVSKLGGFLDFLTSGSRGWAEYYSATGDLFLRIQNVRGMSWILMTSRSSGHPQLPKRIGLACRPATFS